MALNLKKALAYMKKDLSKNFGKLDFEYENEGDKIIAKASVTLKRFDDGIFVKFVGTDKGLILGTAVFDKLEPSYDAFSLINNYNDNHIYFKAFIRDDGYLVFENARFYCDEKEFVDYASDFLGRLIDLQDEDDIQQLTSMTTK